MSTRPNIPNVTSDQTTARASSLRAGVVLLVGLGFSTPSTASTHAIPITIDGTASRLSGQIETKGGQTAPSALMDLRRISGLTWDELAAIFGVSRRSMHHWLNGKPLSASNEHFVRSVLAAIRSISNGDSRETRALLLTDNGNGASLYDTLRSGEFSSMPTIGGALNEGYHLRAKRTRRPPNPTELVMALNDVPRSMEPDLVRVGKRRPSKS